MVPHVEIEKNLRLGCRKPSLRKAPPELAQPCKRFEWTENLQHEYFTGRFLASSTLILQCVPEKLAASPTPLRWLPAGPSQCCYCSVQVCGWPGWSLTLFLLQHTPWHKEVPGRGLSTCVCGNNIPAELRGYRGVPSLLPSRPGFLHFAAW